MDYNSLFKICTGFEPYPYQQRLAMESWPDMLDVPTGLGKTAAVTLAWIWKRGFRPHGRKVHSMHETPRRLVWCLPMRVLVEQTVTNVKGWLERLGWLGESGEGKVSVHQLMGGEGELGHWTQYPEEDTVIVGTQDMLLSRALMRGYGMSRYRWPVEFALLHNDTLWVLDEIQLMGPGLTTSAQLEAFRRKWPLAKHAKTLWISATLNPRWLETVDFRSHLSGIEKMTLDETEKDYPEVRMRVHSKKSLQRAQPRLTEEGSKNKAKEYIKELAEFVLSFRKSGKNTIVVLNNVERAQSLYKALQKEVRRESRLLLHARFRAHERRTIEQALKKMPAEEGRIIVSTQAVEAGVDITSKILITELAPWASMVQRFGRCNRYGEENEKDGGEIYWVDIEESERLALPYDPEMLKRARSKLDNLSSAASGNLPVTDDTTPLHLVLRQRDFLDLFNTEPDLSGFDVDVGEYIRDADEANAQVFWRDFDDPNNPMEMPADRLELCPVSLGQLFGFKKEKWIWDSLAKQWVRWTAPPRGGMTLLLRASDGGYDPELGFVATAKKPVPVVGAVEAKNLESYDEDFRSRQNRSVLLENHSHSASQHAKDLCTALGEKIYGNVIAEAAKWHDVGKSHPVFQKTLHSCEEARMGILAKSPCYARHERTYFRHELASMLAWLEHGPVDDRSYKDLIAFLVLSHHGKIRMSLRALPDEKAPPEEGRRYARGVWEGDRLPALTLGNLRIPETELNLEIMELGQGPRGSSWTARTQRLLEIYGPFVLSWLESLVRIVDWRASA